MSKTRHLDVNAWVEWFEGDHSLDTNDLGALWKELRMVLTRGPNHFFPAEVLLSHAYDLDPKSYRDDWLPYLILAEFPVFYARDDEHLEQMTRWLPEHARVEVDPTRAWPVADASSAPGR